MSIGIDVYILSTLLFDKCILLSMRLLLCVQDEKGTAAYKTVELDTFLSDVPVQYRNTQNHETPGFLALFDKEVRLNGIGCECVCVCVLYAFSLRHACGKKIFPKLRCNCVEDWIYNPSIRTPAKE